MAADTDALDRAIAATNRAIRNIESPADSTPYLVEWVDKQGGEPWDITVVHPERFAIAEPERFAAYLASGKADEYCWAAAHLLPKRLRPTRPEPEEKNEKQTDQK